jgi:hypothetical protein
MRARGIDQIKSAERSFAKLHCSYVGHPTIGRKPAMTRADQYRQHAREAERQARRAPDSDAKEGLHAIAQQWRELAEQVERRELEPTQA